MPERNVPILNKLRFMNCLSIFNYGIKQIIIVGIIKPSVQGKQRIFTAWWSVLHHSVGISFNSYFLYCKNFPPLFSLLQHLFSRLFI